MNTPTTPEPDIKEAHHFTNNIVKKFLYSNLSLILILLATLVGVAALMITPREEDPQIVVPMADVYVNFPGHSATEVEQLVSTPMEKILYQIDGVEYVYSMSHQGQAIITVRYYVGEDRERSLVKLYKKIDENLDVVPPGVTGWVVKPVEIDDVPIVTLTLTGGNDEMALRRVSEELTQRLAAVKDVSRAYVVGGRPRVVNVYMNADAMAGYSVSPLEIQKAIAGANVQAIAGSYQQMDKVLQVEVGQAFASAEELRNLVIGVSQGRPVFLKDVARVEDGPAEASSYVRHGWGPGRGFAAEEGSLGTQVGAEGGDKVTGGKAGEGSAPAVTIAISKKKGSNAVWVAKAVLAEAGKLEKQFVPTGMELVVTRNYGLTANEKVNELVEALAVAIFIVIALLTLGLGWRESLIVAVAVPVVFGLTLAVNFAFGFTINRVTLFALILSLGLLVDDPIVDVENISRHFALQKKATRKIVMEAVAEIRPPLITATLAVIVSFLPMFFITGMMGPYMRPMALNVPVAMLMSMVVAFTITPWLSYHVLKRNKKLTSGQGHQDPHDAGDVKQTFLYKLFYPIMAPLLHSKLIAWGFLGLMGLATVGAMYLAADRSVPLKMLPFDNKNELLLVLDSDQGTTLERTDTGVRAFEEYLASVPEITDYTSYVGVASPMDFNGLVRHYYLRQGPSVAEIRLNLVAKKSRTQQSHALALRMRDDLTAIAKANHLKLKIVEVPPGPPVLASVVAEVYGQPDSTYEEILAAADTVHARLDKEPGVVDTDDSREAPETKQVFVPDREKAALHGISVDQIAQTVQATLGGATVGTMRQASERNPLLIELRLPEAERSATAKLAQLRVKGADGALVALAELGRWDSSRVDQTIYHKNLQRVAYVFAETAGRPPADVVVDVQADQRAASAMARKMPPAGVNRDKVAQSGAVEAASAKPVDGRTFFANGSGVRWAVPDPIKVDFAGEGEWKITLDVFRDLGMAFGAAMVAIYVLLVAQTKSFVIPLVVMMAIPLTVLGVMPGFWLLNHLGSHMVGAYANSVFFTATGMIGMIALAGIVTRDSIILVDFIHLSLKRGRSLFDAIMESRVVRLRPILLTASAAMLSAVPIIVDPIFSGLAWSLIFGLFASTIFTLFVIPVCYWLLYAHKPGHGVPEEADAPESSTAVAAGSEK
jgi:multidrug efflux pump subunit AcrB